MSRRTTKKLPSMHLAGSPLKKSLLIEQKEEDEKGEQQQQRQLKKSEGTRLAYVGPYPWTLSANIRREILFGRLMDEERYEAILKLCGLQPDIHTLPDGDLTRVGFQKTRLSEEQLQRVCLARAIYQDADIYLLHEPLNYLGSQDREQIFQHILGPNGLLKRKTRILSTRDLCILPDCDKIFFVSQGRILESGSYQQLLDKNGDFAKWVGKNYENSTAGRNGSTSIRAKICTSSISDEVEDSEDEDDEKTEHGLKLRTIWTYCRFASLPLTFLSFLGLAAYLCFEIGANVWLSLWSKDSGRRLDLNSIVSRAATYAFLGFGQCVSLIITFCCMCFAFKRFAINFYKSMVRSVFRAPIEFFDTTSLNSIMQRFGRDVSEVDVQIPVVMLTIVGLMVAVVGSFIAISVIHPFFLIVISVICILYVFLMSFYMTCNSRLHALQHRTLQQVVNAIIDSILAGTTIRAYRSQHEFANLHDELMDRHSRVVFASEQINRWFDIRLHFLANIIVFATAMFSVAYKSSLNSAHVGLTMFYAINVSNKLVRWVPSIVTLIEDPMSSLQRIQEYSNSIKPEGFWTREQSPFSPNDWPDRGGIVFQDYTVKRKHGNGFLLQGINAEIPPGQKIAVVGGKGSGKSTLVYGLFRASKPEYGTVFVDGIDSAMLGLHDLRSKIAYIPKTPMICKGSIRYNLDPVKEYSDDNLWRAIEMSHLTSCITSLEGGLDCIMSKEILSFGQRQQLSLARALLKNAKILVWDEDPVAEDLESDQLIRNIVTKELADCTVITISHRLYTVRSYDRVIVMEDGRIVEDGNTVIW
ncbi:Multidrug resistance-associated protein 1 [Araneus ventricosus]|uniref:Multidrug resistance-associated protein 1 n=1 Tax=Araneus ventricosus TaxID=182803 RepID=A0A4Y2G4F2_ARAVE|nr:Multidrug resistance-associated protein 1 [Araneus ventricosus]